MKNRFARRHTHIGGALGENGSSTDESDAAASKDTINHSPANSSSVSAALRDLVDDPLPSSSRIIGLRKGVRDKGVMIETLQYCEFAIRGREELVRGGRTDLLRGKP